MTILHVMFGSISMLFLFAGLYAQTDERSKDLSFITIWLAIFACAAGMLVGAIV